MELYVVATAAMEIPRGERENYDRVTWVACVFSYKFVMPVEIVKSENHINEVKQRLTDLLSFSNTLAKPLHCRPSALCDRYSISQ